MEGVEEEGEEPPCQAGAAVTHEEKAVRERSVVEKHYYDVVERYAGIGAQADSGGCKRECVGAAKCCGVRITPQGQTRGSRQQQKHCPRYPKLLIY